MNTSEWKDSLKATHGSVVQEKNRIKEEIESLIKNIDAVELLSHICLVSQFAPEDNPESNYELRDKPILHFLIGLYLKNGNTSNRLPTNEDIGRIIELLNKYFIFYLQDLVLQSAKKEIVPESDGIILSARLQKVISQINHSIYQFQLEDLLNRIFGQFEGYFIKKVGFTIFDALEYGRKIIQRYERCLSKRIDEAREARERALEEFKDAEKRTQIRESLKNKDVSDDKLIESYFSYLIFTLTQKIFLFEAEKFCKDEGINDIVKFRRYLETLSCKFGEANKDFDSPLKENLIFTRPIICIDQGKYFSPVPRDLISNLPLIFESFLKEEKNQQTGMWEKHQAKKSKYTVDKICEYFSRLFPKQNIYRNLKYRYKERDYELDVLIPYDNKIFIIESKSGLFTEPAKRGGIDRLKTDLKKLIEEAYEQGKRTAEYIKSTQNASFKDNNGIKTFEVKLNRNKIDFFLINVTFEHLMNLSTGLKSLQSLGLFEGNQYPWSVYLYELDIITQHILSPTIFIYYLEKRLVAQDENKFWAFDELSFFAWYLEKGNFYVPLADDGRVPDYISLDVTWVAGFDNHYIHGKEAPKLKIESDLLEIIKILELLRPIGYSEITSVLLDFDSNARELILGKIKELIAKSKQERAKHDFSLYNKVLDIGFTFMTQDGREGLRERLSVYCALKKYHTKTKRWIGIGRDISDDEWFVNEFVYLNSVMSYNTCKISI